jgi:hypothetical protein
MGNVDSLEGICDEVLLEAWKWIPQWMERETLEGKKAGYPQVLSALEELREKLHEGYGFGNVAVYLDTVVRTLEVMSPQIYEYYRRVMDLFREEVRRGCSQLRELVPEKEREFGHFRMDGEGKPEMDVFREAIGKGCRLGVILVEKYQVYLK